MPDRMFGKKVRKLSAEVETLNSDDEGSSDESLFEDLLDISYDEYRVALNSAPSYSDSIVNRHTIGEKVEKRLPGDPGVGSLYGQDVNVRLGQFLAMAKQALQHYFAGEDVRVLVDCLREHNIVEFRSAFVAYALRLVLDYERHERTRLCFGFSDLKSAGILTDRSMLTGMEKLFTAMSDIVLDVPHCCVMLLEVINGLCCCGALDVCVYMRLPGIFYENVPATLTPGCNEPLVRLMREDLDSTKSRIKIAVHEYFASGDLKTLDAFFSETTDTLCALQNKLLVMAKEKQALVDTNPEWKDKHVYDDHTHILDNHGLDLNRVIPCGAGGVIESRLASEIEAWKTSQGKLTDRRNFTWATSYHELVRSLMIISMDMTDSEREMASHAIDVLFSDKIGPDDCRIGFSRIIGDVDELRLDIPHIQDYTIKFLCRAIVDEVLPPSYLYETYRLRLGGIAGMKLCKECQVQLFGDKKEGVRTILSRFRKIWSQTSEQQTWDNAVKDILIGFFDDKKTLNAAKKIINLELIPSQCKMVVKRIATSAAQRGTDKIHSHPHTDNTLKQKVQKTDTPNEIIASTIDLLTGLNAYAEFSQQIIQQGLKTAQQGCADQGNHLLPFLQTLSLKAQQAGII